MSTATTPRLCQVIAFAAMISFRSRQRIYQMMADTPRTPADGPEWFGGEGSEELDLQVNGSGDV